MDRSFGKVGIQRIRTVFGTWNNALIQSGLPIVKRHRYPENELKAEVYRIFKALGHVPSGDQWDRVASIRRSVIKSRFGGIRNACLIARQKHPELPVVEPASPIQRGARCSGEKLGQPMNFPPFSHEPVNEPTTQALFAALAPTLGITILKFRSRFPDAMAERRSKHGKIERIEIEVEFQSISYLRHGHPLDRSLVLVCWIHNWPNIPAHIELIVLSNAIPKLNTDQR